jgi:hypothetical protein
MLDSLHLFSTVCPPAATMVKEPVSPVRSGVPFIEIVSQFNTFGERTVEHTEGGIPYLINEFWTARQRQAHSLH